MHVKNLKIAQKMERYAPKYANKVKNLGKIY